MRLFSILLMAIFVAGCAAPETRVRYANPNANHDQFDDVSYQCQKNVRNVITAKKNGYGEVTPEQVDVDCDKFNTCMAKHGFTRSPDGEFLTSKDLQLKCK
jgi:hypothetical protein